MKKMLLLCLLLPVVAGAQIITTVAGNNTATFAGNGGPATSASLRFPRSVVVDAAGNMYIADGGNMRIRKVDVSGTISTIAGNGTPGYSGDGGAATAAQLYEPWSLALDKYGNIYFSDSYNNVIRKINAAGIISTVVGDATGAGGGTGGYGGDGGPATAAKLFSPFGLAIDTGGNLFIADFSNHVVRKVNAAGIISTVAGNHTRGYLGDGGPATAAELYNPAALAFDGSNLLFIADFQNNVIRKIDATGAITTVVGTGFGAGTGGGGYTGDGGPATAAELAHPMGLVIDGSGNIYFSDESSSHIRKVDAGGVINTIAGNGSTGYSGDGGPATAAGIYYPYGITLDAVGNIYFADAFNHVIRKIGSSVLAANAPGVEPAAVDLFPNPAGKVLNITSPVAITAIGVSNISGAVACSCQINGRKAQIDVSNLPAGTYIVTINGKGAREFVKR